ncbi:MAG: putative sugar O-methyltransferase [Lachnospiraceae bacterium]|nr:putative sugar O-methyltransferase [Lachnospiraceae bacterium]
MNGIKRAILHFFPWIGYFKRNGRRGYIITEKSLKTSASDNGNYPDFCFLASVNSEVFDSFRKNEIYNVVLEHLTESIGNEYLEIILSRDTFDEITWELFKQNDLYGSPLCFNYTKIGIISPTTLRYIKVLQDLIIKFGSLEDMDICEIGIGYGGQCRIIASYFNVKSYTLVDLSQVIALAKTYLNKYVLSSEIRFLTMNELNPKQKYDLVISNYAFSELRLDIQECYQHKVIDNSSKGYITYNRSTHSSHSENVYTLEDYIKKIPNLMIEDEMPVTDEKNKILFWS